MAEESPERESSGEIDFDMLASHTAFIDALKSGTPEAIEGMIGNSAHQ